MSNNKLEGIRKNLWNSWEYIQKLSVWENHNKYKGVPIREEWKDFELFVKENWIRYYRAEIKWKNYKRLAPRKGHSGKLKNRNVRFSRKIKEKGFTLENTVFTSPSDMKKYDSSTYKFKFGDRLLGTRDIKNILKKRGIDINMESLTQRLRKGEDLFSVNLNHKHLWKGKYLNFRELSLKECINYDVLKKNYYRTGNINEAVKKSKTSKPRKKHLFKGRMLSLTEISKILSKDTNIKSETIRKRITKHGLNMDLVLKPTTSKST